MTIQVFIDYIAAGFDVSFNYADVFYTISVVGKKSDGTRIFGIGGDNGFASDFESLESIPDFSLDGRTIRDIVESIPDEDIFW